MLLKLYKGRHIANARYRVCVRSTRIATADLALKVLVFHYIALRTVHVKVAEAGSILKNGNWHFFLWFQT